MTAILFVLLTTLSAPPLNGGFIQYDDDVIQQITAKGWVQVLDQMNALGMKVVIVQFLGIANDAGETPAGGGFQDCVRPPRQVSGGAPDRDVRHQSPALGERRQAPPRTRTWTGRPWRN